MINELLHSQIMIFRVDVKGHKSPLYQKFLVYLYICITSQFGLEQTINEQTRIPGKSKSYINLIFTSQPDVVMDLGIHLSLHQNCHYQILIAKSNLEVHYPTTYKREV